MPISQLDGARKLGGLMRDKEGEDNMVQLPGCKFQTHCFGKGNACLDMWICCSAHAPCIDVEVRASCTPPHLSSIQREL